MSRSSATVHESDWDPVMRGFLEHMLNVEASDLYVSQSIEPQAENMAAHGFDLGSDVWNAKIGRPVFLGARRGPRRREWHGHGRRRRQPLDVGHAAEQEHGRLDAALGERARDDEAVAAVVAAPGQHRHAAALQLDQVAGQREPQAGTLLLPAGRAVDLTEHLDVSAHEADELALGDAAVDDARRQQRRAGICIQELLDRLTRDQHPRRLLLARRHGAVELLFHHLAADQGDPYLLAVASDPVERGLDHLAPLNGPRGGIELAANPPPAGASDIPGLEIAGTVVSTGQGSTHMIGQRVCALVAGGGYAEYVAADARFCLPLPERYSDVEAAPLLAKGRPFQGEAEMVRKDGSTKITVPGGVPIVLKLGEGLAAFAEYLAPGRTAAMPFHRAW